MKHGQTSSESCRLVNSLKAVNIASPTRSKITMYLKVELVQSDERVRCLVVYKLFIYDQPQNNNVELLNATAPGSVPSSWGQAGS